ncbi:hypothetical protein GDO81_006170 [Engystomops pustulosus]|uniref:Uncharacterized protein n=1 Tax=Engystomops pustulosus TaxID=76066 RepID=A0AAV7CWT1_ENGPU|nr:hypothetical protein GDO81_006170 [Engystomops pustulosus]
MVPFPRVDLVFQNGENSLAIFYLQLVMAVHELASFILLVVVFELLPCGNPQFLWSQAFHAGVQRPNQFLAKGLWNQVLGFLAHGRLVVDLVFKT